MQKRIFDIAISRRGPQFMVDNQHNFRAFIKSLMNNDYVNKSLNINFFNSERNLYDLYNIVDFFTENIDT